MPQASRHPQVDEEHATRFEPDDQVLAAALDAVDALADELAGDDRRCEGAHETRIVDRCVNDPRAFEHRRDAGANGLDLGQLGHEPSLDGPPGVGRRRGRSS